MKNTYLYLTANVLFLITSTLFAHAADGWIEGFDQAIEKAKQEDKDLLVELSLIHI